jgi:hypothetical protein
VALVEIMPPLAFFHTYCKALPVLVLSVTLVLVQVSGPSLLALNTGGARSLPTVVLAVWLQPLLAVTLRV